jgi:hypothetical protein
LSFLLRANAADRSSASFAMSYGVLAKEVSEFLVAQLTAFDAFYTVLFHSFSVEFDR